MVNAKLYIKRKERRLKQADVAKMLNMHKQTYYRKESGHLDFTIPEAIKLATLFECSLDELFMN